MTNSSDRQQFGFTSLSVGTTNSSDSQQSGASILVGMALGAGLLFYKPEDVRKIEAKNTFDQAVALADEGNIQYATPLFLESLEKDPTYAPTYNCLALIYMNYGELDQSLMLAKMAIVLASDPDEKAYFSETLAEVYLHKGDLNAAMKANDQFVLLTLSDNLASQDEQVRLKVVNALSQIGERAVPTLCNVLKKDPHPEVRRSAAQALGIIASQETGTES
ncbi:MAG: HEAT repeat domain-containing protein [Planktothrix sp.]